MKITGWDITPIEIPTAQHVYDVDYAAEVHDGEVQLDRPARPWMETAILEMDFAQEMADEMPKEFSIPAVKAAWMRVNENLGLEMDDAMSDERWAWPRITRRQNGTTAGLIRDIRDTDRLHDSRELNFI